jgi:hypothetical protein
MISGEVAVVIALADQFQAFNGSLVRRPVFLAKRNKSLGVRTVHCAIVLRGSQAGAVLSCNIKRLGITPAGIPQVHSICCI